MPILELNNPDGTTTDLNFFQFSKDILGYDKLTDAHKPWFDEAENPAKRKLFLKSRGTYKSTIYTVSYIIWRLVQNPNERILIANSVSDNAEAFLREISAHFLRNEKFIAIFGNMLDSKAAKVSSLTVTNRTKHYKEPSISTIGVLGNLVSSHYSLIICDDLVNTNDRESSIIRDKKKAWFLDLLSILDPDGELICVGTRWHSDDLYNYIINELNPQLKKKERYLISVDSCYLEDGITPKYPSILSEETLTRLKIEKGFVEFSSQYVNVVLAAESQIFQIKDFKTFKYLNQATIFDKESKEVTVVGYCDLSIGKSKSADYTAIITLGKAKDGSIYLMDVSLKREPPDATISRILGLHKHFNFNKFGIESNLFQSLFVDNLRKTSKDESIYLPITNVYNISKKELRIQSIQPLIKDGTLKIREDWQEDKDTKELMEQLLYFPVHRYDDGPDALAGAVSLCKKTNWGTPIAAVGSGNTPVEFTESSLINISSSESPREFNWQTL